jgi:hypothetical protein
VTYVVLGLAVFGGAITDRFLADRQVTLLGVRAGSVLLFAGLAATVVFFVGGPGSDWLQDQRNSLLQRTGRALLFVVKFALIFAALFALIGIGGLLYAVRTGTNLSDLLPQAAARP